MAENDTIAAISTPPGNGAIGIIRLSGPDSRAILTKVWQGKVHVNEFEPRKIYTGHIKELRWAALLDLVIVFLMKAPSSYTGEDLIEIQGHGGQRLMEILLENLVAAGDRKS